MKVYIFLFLIVLLSSLVSASLGISPAVMNIDYVPGEEYEIHYTIISSSPDSELEIYVAGDLSEYVTLDKEKSIGGGGFSVKIKLPYEIDKPGEHRISVGVREKASEDEFIGTAIDISGAIKIFVPYPGRYIESSLSIPNGNTGEPIPVEAYVMNRGRESLNVDVDVKFFDGAGNEIYSMPFSSVSLEPTQDRFFRKFLDTASYGPGRYFAEAVVDYGDVTKVNATFRIGSLFVNVTNFTRSLPADGIQKFHVDVESMWNNRLDKIFSEIFIFNESWNYSLRTPPVDLDRWEKKTLEGFLDTSNMLGKYKTNVALYYREGSSLTSGELFIIESGLSFRLIIFGLVGIVLIIVILLVILKIKKNYFRFGRRR